MMDEMVVGGVTLLVGAAVWAWLRGFQSAQEQRCGLHFAHDTLRGGGVLLAAALLVAWPDRATPLSLLESVERSLFCGGGVLLLGLGLLGVYMTRGSIALRNLTAEPLVFINAQGQPMFTLAPEPAPGAVPLPSPHRGCYIIVPREATYLRLVSSGRRDLLFVDPRRSGRDADTGQLRVRGLLRVQ